MRTEPLPKSRRGLQDHLIEDHGLDSSWVEDLKKIEMREMHRRFHRDCSFTLGDWHGHD